MSIQLYLDPIKDRIHFSLRGFFELSVVGFVFCLADPTVESITLGVTVSGLGEALRIWKAGYRLQGSEFFVVGPHRFVRHPRYLGTFLVLLGLCLASRSAFSLFYLLLGIAITYGLSIKKHEEILLKKYGPSFVEYRVRVSSFIPQLFPVASESTRPLAFSLMGALFYRTRRELESVIGLIFAFGLLYAYTLVLNKSMFHITFAALISLFLVARLLYSFRRTSKISSTIVS